MRAERYKNKIKQLLDEKDMSVLKLSESTGMTYANIHSNVNKEYIDSSTFSTLMKIKEAIGCKLEDLYEEEK